MSTYTEAVDRELKGLKGAIPGATACCPTCTDANPLPDGDQTHWHDAASEGGFGWQACDACGSNLAGDRHPAHAFDDDKNLYHLEICTDCLMYLANGDEPESWER